MESEDTDCATGELSLSNTQYLCEGDVDDPQICPKTAEADDIEAVSNNDKDTRINTPGSSSQLCSNSIIPSLSAQSGLVINLHNVVASIDLKCPLDLIRIAVRTRNSEYNPRRFHALIMRIREPRTAALIFRSGKIVVTGGRSESGVHLASRKYARIIQKLGYNIQFVDFKILSMLATCDVRFPIMLERFYANQVQFCNYEPELFPGVIFRMLRPRISILIFVSGKIVLTGGKNREDIREALENIYPVLRAFQKK